MPSQEDGISLLGEYSIKQLRTGGQTGSELSRPEKPTSTDWSVENMLDQIGLPRPHDPQTITEAIARWSTIYNTATPVNSVHKWDFAGWNALRSRSPLNERDSAFGFAIETRARVSGMEGGEPLLRPAPRRSSEASLEQFIKYLGFSGFPFDNFRDQKTRDRGLVCFICLSDLGVGEARPGYFATTTGYERVARIVTAANGSDVKTFALSETKSPYSSPIFAERAVHECGHAFGLGDEYGSGDGATITSAPAAFPNLQAKSQIVSTTTTSSGTKIVYNPGRIKWLLPRAIKVGLMDKAPVPLSGSDFQFNLASGHGKRFAKDDLVLIRRPPLGQPDPFTDLRFKVTQPHPDWVEVTQTNVPALDVNLYDASKKHVLICVSKITNPGVELKLIADPILNRISDKGPLTATVCVAAKSSVSIMTPVNLAPPKSSKPLPSPADIIGIYEGGNHFDCGIFRPAGRCKMRMAEDFVDDRNKIIPFCQVCRYIIVDRVDPMKLAALDLMYDPYYPT